MTRPPSTRRTLRRTAAAMIREAAGLLVAAHGLLIESGMDPARASDGLLEIAVTLVDIAHALSPLTEGET